MHCAPRPARPGSRAHALLRLTRKVHLYFGVFISPALLFFAFTGALQTFSLHETTQGSSYKPPAWLAAWAQLHKKQTTEINRRPRPNGPSPFEQNRSQANPTQNGPAQNDAGSGRHKHDNPGQKAAQSSPNPVNATTTNPAPANRAPDTAAAPAPRPKSHLPMKIFFLIVSIGLFLSTVTGIYMSYKYTRRAWLITTLLIAGTVLPLLLLPF